MHKAWPNLALAALAMVATLPGRTQGLGLVTEPLLADLQVDRVTYATINLWATLIGALFCLPCGRLVDSLGSRAVVAGVLAALGATVIGMGSAHGLAALVIGITLTRGLGQSALSVVSLALVGKWFTHRLQYAMGVYSLLVGIGFIAAFPSVGSAILMWGWRLAWSGIGWVLLLVVTPLAWLIVRNPAQAQYGQTGQASDGNTAFTFGEALGTTSFWLFAISSSLFGLAYSGISLFNQSILEQRGFDAAVYHQVLVVSTMVGLLANFGGGWLATRWPLQRLMGLGMGVLGVALAALPEVATHFGVMLYGVTMGISGGVITVVFFSVWGQVFGRAHLGKIQGGAQMMTVLASAVGPLLLAETLQRTGSYDAIFRLLAVLVVLFGLASWLVPLPTKARGLESELAGIHS
jgi:MFS family permease